MSQQRQIERQHEAAEKLLNEHIDRLRWDNARQADEIRRLSIDVAALRKQRDEAIDRFAAAFGPPKGTRV
jgi:predicted nuclease with TOPRIM domain